MNLIFKISTFSLSTLYQLNDVVVKENSAFISVEKRNGVECKYMLLKIITFSKDFVLIKDFYLKKISVLNDSKATS